MEITVPPATENHCSNLLDSKSEWVLKYRKRAPQTHDKDECEVNANDLK